MRQQSLGPKPGCLKLLDVIILIGIHEYHPFDFNQGGQASGHYLPSLMTEVNLPVSRPATLEFSSQDRIERSAPDQDFSAPTGSEHSSNSSAARAEV
jgi:hypothetical protein